MIYSNKDLEREFSTAIKYFQGKEAESNWEKREQVLKLIDSTLRDISFLEHKSILLTGIHDLGLGIADATKSLRTKYALVAFNTIISIGEYLGKEIDSYTFETLFIGLIQCSNSSKQLIANKAKETTISFLSTTTYHNKVITLLSSAFKDKNNQARHFISIYMKTYLETHLTNQHVKSNMERHNALYHIEQFLKNGLLDAIPHVREVCRQIFWLYQQHYPTRSEKILQSFDILTRKQIEKLKPDEMSSNIVRKRELSSYNQSKSQRLKLDKDNATSKNNKQLQLTKPLHTTKPILTPPVFRRTVSDSSMYKLNNNNNHSKTTIPSSISSSSSPKPKPLDKEKYNNNNSNNSNNNNNNSTTPILASASLLHMLRSNNVNVNCNALRILSDRLIPHCQTPLYENDILLPSTVPSRVDLIPVLLDYLSPEKMLKSESLCNQLMSWDCLAGIFVNLLTLQHFIPTLILASHKECRSDNINNNNNNDNNNNDDDGKSQDNGDECTNIKSQLKYYTLTTTIGLKRLKLYLKYNYPNLIKSLLDILLMTNYAGGAGLKDPNAKKELFSSKSILFNNNHSTTVTYKVKDDLVYGLLNWIDELLCDYIGLNHHHHHHHHHHHNDNNNNNKDTTERPYIMKGSESWLSNDEVNIAMNWFKNNDNMELCFESILRLFKTPTLSIHPTLFTLIISLIKHIKSSNHHVFESVVNQLDDDDVTTIKLLDTFIGNDNTATSSNQQQQNNQSLDLSENNIIENHNEVDDDNQDDDSNEENITYYQNTEDLLYDEPPPSYNDVLLQQQLEEEEEEEENNDHNNNDDEIIHSNQTSPSIDIPQQHHHQPTDDINNVSLELLSGGDIDALETSYGSIHLDTMSPEPPLTSTQEPNDIDTIDEHNDTIIEDQNNKKRQDTQVNGINTSMYSISQTSSTHYLVNQNVMNNNNNNNNGGGNQMMDITTLLRLSNDVDGDVINNINNKHFEKKNGWMQSVNNKDDGDKKGTTTLFEYALQKIIDHLNHLIDHRTIIDHLRLLKNLLIHQSTLFQDDTILSFNHLLASKSIYLHREKYTQIAILIDDILNDLFKVIHINNGIMILESIIEEELIRQNKQKMASFSTTVAIMYVDPLDTLFNIISTLSSRMTPELVARLLKKSTWITIFMMGFNHSIISIRKSCVNTLVSFSHVLSNEDIQQYLPGLKDEQRNLLDHYIQQQKKK